MKRLGRIKDLIYDGSLLVEAEVVPPPGTEVVDARRQPVGRVKRVFGPVERPLATVQPAGKPSMGLLGSEVYVDEVRTWPERSKKPRK